MSSFLSKSARVSDRRATPRFTVDCEARLKLAGGERPGRLSDLSESGARFETEKPPLSGTLARLIWGNQDHPCRVMWSSDGRCGIHFDRAIDTAIVAQTAQGDIDVKPRFGLTMGQSGSLRALVPGLGPRRN